jgi:hypothetical protein
VGIQYFQLWQEMLYLPSDHTFVYTGRKFTGHMLPFALP